MDLYKFLEAVAANNNRPWFAVHKDEYEALRMQWMLDLQRLISAMSAWEPGMAAITPQQCSYRFYRDTRFSPDKSPFKTFFSAALSPYTKKTDLASYYLQLDCHPSENGLYAGLWMPSSEYLRKIRHAIVDNIEEWEDIINDPALCATFPEWAHSQPLLKTAPAGWPKDHPQIEYLRMRDYGRFCKLPRQFFRDPLWPEATAEKLQAAKPMVDFLNYSIAEEL